MISKITRPQIREIFLRNGARIEPDRDDLPDWIYESAFELLELAAPAVQGEMVECSVCHGKGYRVAPLDIMLTCPHCQGSGECSAPQPTPAVQGEPVAEVSQETFSSNGTSDIITKNLPIGMKLYAAPQPVGASGLVEALTMARETIASALRANAPDYFTTDADIARHVVIQRIDAAMQEDSHDS